MRRVTRLLPLLLLSFVLAAPVGAASAATGAAKPRTNPWAAYFPAAGVTCTSTVTHADGTTESQRTTTVTKSVRKVVTRVSGSGRKTSLLLPNGKLQSRAVLDQRGDGIRLRATVTTSYPSLAQFRRHRAGSATVAMRMTLPQRMADVALKHGRTLTLTGSYRITSLGSRTVTLADAAATRVEALGVRTRLRAMRIGNATSAFERAVRADMRALFASMSSTEWVAPGRGTVQRDSTDEDGAAISETQVGCR